MALIPEAFFKAVVAIGTPESGKVYWTGTGFLYAHPLEAPDVGKFRIFLITNRHVLNGKKNLVLRFENDKGSSTQFVIEAMIGNAPIWEGHPEQEVDVAALALSGDELHKHIGQLNVFEGNEGALPLSRPGAENLCEGDGVFLLGFPMGLVDQVQNLPIARGGVIARIKDAKANRSKTFLIDCQTFPGNSGGPVLNKPELVAISGTNAIARSYLIGIVAGYHSYQDVAVSRQTGKEKIIFEENSGLSVVFPVDAIVATVLAALSKKIEVAKKHEEALKDSNEVKA